MLVSTVENGGEVSVDIDDAFDHVVRVHAIVRERLEPPSARHDGRRRMNEDEGVALIQDVRDALDVLRLDALLKQFKSIFEIVRCHRLIMP